MSRSIGTDSCPKCVRLGNDTRGDNLVLWDNGHGHCFACGYHKFPKFAINKKEETSVPKTLLPFDFQREVPGDAWKWLLQYGLPFSYWKEIIGFSPSEERLIFRVGEYQSTNGKFERNGQLCFSIGRAIERGQVGADLRPEERSLLLGTRSIPKRKWYVWGDCHRHAEIVNPHQGRNIVLVEDLISAHKVGQLTTTIPLFGTKVHNPVLYCLLNDPRPVVLWLDKDQEFNCRSTALRLQGILNKPVSVTTTDTDPKTYSLEAIGEILNGIQSLA